MSFQPGGENVMSAMVLRGLRAGEVARARQENPARAIVVVVRTYKKADELQAIGEGADAYVEDGEEVARVISCAEAAADRRVMELAA